MDFAYLVPLLALIVTLAILLVIRFGRPRVDDPPRKRQGEAERDSGGREGGRADR